MCVFVLLFVSGKQIMLSDHREARRMVKLSKYLCISFSPLLGGEVAGCPEVSVQSCAALGAVGDPASAGMCGCAAVQNSRVHPQLSGEEAVAFRRKISVSGRFAASQAMGQKTS